MQKTKLQEVIEILKQKGWTDEEITTLTTDLTKAAFSQLYSEAMLSFQDEDFKAIEACKDQATANVEIRKRYQERTGKNPEHEMQAFLDRFAQGFLQEQAKEATGR